MVPKKKLFVVCAEKYLQYKYSSKIPKHVVQKRAILVFDYFFIDYLKKYGLKKMRFESQKYALYELPGKNKMTIIHATIGAPVAAMTLEEVYVLGIKEILILGAAGSLDGHLQPGSIFLPLAAITGDGTSKEYSMKAKVSPSKKLFNELNHRLTNKKIQFVKGICWSTDTPYLETKEKITQMIERNSMCVEMEIAACFAVSERLGLGAVALLTVSDFILATKWRPEFYARKHALAKKNILKIALDYFSSKDA